MNHFLRAILLLMVLFICPAYAGQNSSIGAAINHCNLYLKQQNYQKALLCYQPLAIQGESAAQFNMGMLYENGLGVSKDLYTAFTWYKKSAPGGFSFAQAKLGEMYTFGVGTSQNCNKGLYWINKAAEQNNPWAWEDLAKVYHFGLCVKKDENKALYWQGKLQSVASNQND